MINIIDILDQVQDLKEDVIVTVAIKQGLVHVQDPLQVTLDLVQDPDIDLQVVDIDPGAIDKDQDRRQGRVQGLPQDPQPQYLLSKVCNT